MQIFLAFHFVNTVNMKPNKHNVKFQVNNRRTNKGSKCCAEIFGQTLRHKDTKRSFLNLVYVSQTKLFRP